MIPNRIHTLLLDEIIIKTNIDFAIVRQSHQLFHFGLDFHRKNVFLSSLVIFAISKYEHLAQCGEANRGRRERKK